MEGVDKGKSKPSGRKAPPPKGGAKLQPKKKAGGRSAATSSKTGARRGGSLLRRGVAVVVGALVVAVGLDVLWLRERVRSQLAGRVHEQPARVVGQGYRLQRGAVATPEGWRVVLDRAGLKEQQDGRVDAPGQYELDGATWTIRPKDGPSMTVTVKDRHIKGVTRTKDGVDSSHWEAPLPPLALLTGDEKARRALVHARDIPETLRDAVVAIEDARFERHIGVDPRGLARATWANLKARSVVQGGSTITQQLAKNLFLSADRTVLRKFQEAVLALLVEQEMSKEQILEAYLNEIYLGQRDGWSLFGVGEAARAWFGKDVGALDLQESATLAGAIHSPNRTVPWRHPEEAARRRDLVLRAMAEQGHISHADAKAAMAGPVAFAKVPGAKQEAPWALQAVRAELSPRYADEALYRDGMTVVTTLDPMLQSAAEQAVRQWAKAMKKAEPKLFQGGGPEVAVLALDPHDGAIRALVGGTSFSASQWNRALQAKRQAGSAMKPIVLAAAMQSRGPALGPATLVDDSPLHLDGRGKDGGSWSPRNYDGRFLGPIPLWQAVEQSRNLPFVRLGLDVGLGDVVKMASDLGVQSPLAAVPALAMGSQEVTALDLATAYATFAREGRRPKPHLLAGVRDRDGAWVERKRGGDEPALEPRIARAITGLLRGVVERGTAKGVRDDGFTLPAAGKTGTTNGGRDAWMVGYTPDLVAVVWVGFDADRTLGLPASRVAVPLWTRFMNGAAPFLSGEDFGRGAEWSAPGDAPAAEQGWKDLVEDAAQAAGTAAGDAAHAVERSAAEVIESLREEDEERRAEERRAARKMGP